MSLKKLFIIALALALFAQGQAHAAGPEKNRVLATKFGIHLGYGTLNTALSSTGVTSRGADAFLVYYFTPTVALGAGYMADSPFSGARFFGRYYFWGQGTRSWKQYASGTSEVRDDWAFYAGPEVMQRNYTYTLTQTSVAATGSTATLAPTPETLSGSVVSFNAVLGMDRKLTSNLELNAEATMGAYSIYASDPRIVIKGYVMYFGVAYLW